MTVCEIFDFLDGLGVKLAHTGCCQHRRNCFQFQPNVSGAHAMLSSDLLKVQLYLVAASIDPSHRCSVKRIETFLWMQCTFTPQTRSGAQHLNTKPKQKRNPEQKHKHRLPNTFAMDDKTCDLYSTCCLKSHTSRQSIIAHLSRIPFPKQK